MVAPAKKCDHSGAKRGIFICGSVQNGLTKTEHVYICHECKAIYLHRYRHDAALGDERTDIIMPDEVKGVVKFHKETAGLIRKVHEAIGRTELEVIDNQATAIRNYVLDRLEQLEHERLERECNEED